MGRKIRWTFIALIALLAFLTGVLIALVDAPDESWRIPPWKAGDRVEWEYLSFDPYTGEVNSRTTSELVLRGPVERVDGDGIAHPVHRWERIDLPDGGYDWYSVDLERGISFEFYWPSATGGSTVLEYAPGKAFANGLALQGTEFREGETRSRPVGFLNGTVTFTASSMTSGILQVEAVRLENTGLPYESVRSGGLTDPLRYIYQYERGSPYPSSVTVYRLVDDVRATDPDEKTWAKVTQRNLLSAAFSGTVGEVPSNAGLSERVHRHEAPRAIPDATARFIDGGIDPRFPASEILEAARGDEALQRYLKTHPQARLLDLATLRMQGDQEETILWNLTWGDEDSGRWYSFVRAKTLYPGDTVLKEVGLAPDTSTRDSFGPWQTAGYSLDVEWRDPPSTPQLTLASARALLEERAPDAEDPFLVRWGPLVVDAQHKPVRGAVHFVSEAPAWAVSSGSFTYSRDGEGDLLPGTQKFGTFWVLSESGTVAMTPYAERFPEDI